MKTYAHTVLRRLRSLVWSAAVLFAATAMLSLLSARALDAAAASIDAELPVTNLVDQRSDDLGDAPAIFPLQASAPIAAEIRASRSGRYQVARGHLKGRLVEARLLAPQHTSRGHVRGLDGDGMRVPLLLLYCVYRR